MKKKEIIEIYTKAILSLKKDSKEYKALVQDLEKFTR